MGWKKGKPTMMYWRTFPVLVLKKSEYPGMLWMAILWSLALLTKESSPPVQLLDADTVEVAHLGDLCLVLSEGQLWDSAGERSSGGCRQECSPSHTPVCPPQPGHGSPETGEWNGNSPCHRDWQELNSENFPAMDKTPEIMTASKLFSKRSLNCQRSRLQ